MNFNKSFFAGAVRILGICLLLMVVSCNNGNPSNNNNNNNNSSGTLTDEDGNVYQAVKIGNQVWMAENLRTTKYNDGTAIPHVADTTTWASLTTPGYCYYNNTTNADSIKKFGALYNWYAVDTKKLAPTGWRVPDTTDWNTLQEYLIANGYNWDGTTTGNKIAKSLAAKSDWVKDTAGGITWGGGAIANDLTKNGSSGFSALPGGNCSYPNFNAVGFRVIGHWGFWWSSTVATYGAYCRYLDDTGDEFFTYNTKGSCGFSVRLVKD
jgi:uncharacterized protein (TIGR02145 family)